MARHVVILAGGSGTRLWPRSREKSPKHLLTLHGQQSLLQSTLERVSRLTENVYVVTERSQVKSIREQLPDLPDERFIVEPARRGTASALGLAAVTIAERDPGATMLSVHADHYLGHDEEAYLKTLAGDGRSAPAVRLDGVRLHPGRAAARRRSGAGGVSGGPVCGKA
jgi:mannose-1-phosphate guanylyltransferase